jgi:hypothetical protein
VLEVPDVVVKRKVMLCSSKILLNVCVRAVEPFVNPIIPAPLYDVSVSNVTSCACAFGAARNATVAAARTEMAPNSFFM